MLDDKNKNAADIENEIINSASGFTTHYRSEIISLYALDFNFKSQKKKKSPDIRFTIQLGCCQNCFFFP